MLCADGVLATDSESVAVMLKFAVPVTVGVPPIVPKVELSTIPVGNDPEVTVQMYGGVPPVAVSCCAGQRMLTTQLWRSGVVIVTVPVHPPMVMLIGLTATVPMLSVTFHVTG